MDGQGGAGGDGWTDILKTVFVRPDHIDLEFVFGQGDNQERIGVDSTWLLIRSEGMATFFDSLKEGTREIIIEDITPRAFRQALHYIFAGTFQPGLMDDDIVGLFRFDEKFPTTGLIDDFVDFLEDSGWVQVDSFIRIWRLAKLHKMEELEEMVVGLMLKHATNFFETDYFLTLTVEELEQLVESDDLFCGECDVFLSVIRWGRYQIEGNFPNIRCDSEPLREILKTLIPRIRFTLMSPEAINDVVRPERILTEEELTNIEAHGLQGVTPRFNPLPRNQYSLDQDTSDEEMDSSDPDLQESNEAYDRLSQMSSSAPPFPFPFPEETCTACRAIPNLSHLSPLYRLTYLFHLKSKGCRHCRVSTKDTQNNQQRATEVDEFIYEKRLASYDSWHCFILKFCENPEESLKKTAYIILNNVSFSNTLEYIPLFPRLYLPSLREVYLDLLVTINTETRHKLTSGIARFERHFDITKYLFFKRKENDLDQVFPLQDLWDMKLRMTLIINGVTLLELKNDGLEKELTIGFRNDSQIILSGVRKGDRLLKLNLMKTDVPNFDHFPSKHLKEVMFYHVWALSENDVSRFLSKCPSLETLCCWVICPWWENSKPKCTDYNPTKIDLEKDLKSKQLKHLALCKVLLKCPTHKIIKPHMTRLILDNCYFPNALRDNIHNYFPNLVECSLRSARSVPGDEKKLIKDKGFSESISLRMVRNLLSLENIVWIRIWGLDWEERQVTEVNSKTGRKELRNSERPISDEEVAEFKSLFESWSISEPENITNFILARKEVTSDWDIVILNHYEPKELDDGFWDLVDKFDYQFYNLKTFFKSYEVMQDQMEINLGLPQ